MARKDSQILLIKILEDGNSISFESVQEMKKISSYIKAAPLIIAVKAGGKLEDNVVYSRFGISTLNFNTFKNCIENRFLFIRRTKAGLTASLTGDRLKQVREDGGISLNNLAQRIGVSTRMISKYENENVDIRVNKALKLYDIFGHSIFNKINVFESEKINFEETKSDISIKYNELGFESTEIKKMPFDVIAKKEKELIFTEVGDKINPQFQSLSKLIDSDTLIIFKKKKPKEIPGLTKKEFFRFEEADELIKFLREFG